jgi:polyisoprenoid-binding protein YceI
VDCLGRTQQLIHPIQSGDSMKRIHAVAILAFVLATVVSTASAQLAVRTNGEKRVTLNEKVGNNQFVWISEAPLENIKGSAEGVSGAFTIDPKNLASIRGTVSAQVATMKSGNASRDEHIRGSQWLNAARHPQITFTIASVSGVKVNGNKASGIAKGTFTMNGVAKPLSIPFSLTYLEESAATRKRAAGDLVMITADFKIALKDYNVAGTRGTIGSKVGETIEINAKLFGSTN